MRPPLRLVLAALVLAGCPAAEPPPPPPAPTGPTSLTYGVVAPLGAAAAEAEAKAAAPLLSKALGLPVKERVLDYAAAVGAIEKGELDVALVPPLTFVRAGKGAKMETLRKAVFNGQATYRAVVFVRADSKAKSLADLKKQSMAFVQRGSLSGSLAPRGLLRDAGLDPATAFAKVQELADHAAVCLAVAGKKADAGATFTNYAAQAADLARGGPDLANVVPDGCAKALGDKLSTLRALAVSEPVPNSLLTIRSDLPKDLVAKLAEAVDELSKSDAGRAQLRAAFGADGFVVAFADDLDPLRRALDQDGGAAEGESR